MALTESDQALLAFAALQWKFDGAREAAIQDRFGMSAVRYHQHLNRIIDDPTALDVDPVLVRRLLRVRSARQALRSVQRLTDRVDGVNKTTGQVGSSQPETDRS